MSFAPVPARRSILDSLIAAVVLAAAVVAVSAPIRDDDVLGHAASHLAVGLPLMLLIVAARRWPASASPLGRRILLIGMIVFVAGQFLEAAGAFGYDGYARVNALAALHDAGLMAVVGIPVSLAGLAVVLVANLRRPGEPVWKRLLLASAFAIFLVVVVALLFGA